MIRAPATKAPVEIRPEPTQTADIVVEAASVTVTMWAPRLDPDRTQVIVTPNSIRLQAKEPEAVHLLIPLPVAVQPARYVLRSMHGVLDFLLVRPSV